MVISTKHKYIFIELPRTGTTAISHALCNDYEGKTMFNKHTNLYRARKDSKINLSDYFVFSCIRHPMDRTVSVYEKYRTNYGNIRESYAKNFNEIAWWKLPTKFIYYLMLQRVQYAQRPGITFESYFRKYYKAPYSDWAILDHKEMDAVIRFEHLEEDFRRVCEKIGMSWKGEIGQRNVTTSKKKKWQDYYTDKDMKRRVEWVFLPYLNEFGYSFPEDTHTPKSTALNRMVYHTINFFRKIGWKYFSSGK